MPSPVPSSCNAGWCSGPSPGREGRRGSPELAPSTRLRSLPSSSSGVGEVRLGAAGRWCLNSASMPAGPVQVDGGRVNGVLEQPGNPAFCKAVGDWRDLLCNMEPTRESKRTCKPELKYRGELPGNHSSNASQEQKLPRRSRDKENRKAQATSSGTEMYFDNQNPSMKRQGVSGMAVTC